MARITSLATRLRRFDRQILGLLGIVLCGILFAMETSSSEAAARNPVRELGRPKDSVSVVPGEWSIVQFQAVGNPSGLPRGVLVRPNAWVAREGFEVGNTFRLEEHALNLDLDVEVTGIEEVVSLDVIPVVDTRRGPRHVIGWIERQASEILTIGFRAGRSTPTASGAGGQTVAAESIEVTREHPFHAADRWDWVPAGDLRTGERVTLVHGGVGVVDRIVARGAAGRVCNLQVAGEAEFAVGETGLVVHNSYVYKNKHPDGTYVGSTNNHPDAPGGRNGRHRRNGNLDDMVSQETSEVKGMTRRQAEQQAINDAHASGERLKNKIAADSATNTVPREAYGQGAPYNHR